MRGADLHVTALASMMDEKPTLRELRLQIAAKHAENGSMVDRNARRRASELITKFRDGAITNMEFQASWPRYNRKDRGLHAIEAMLWRFYEDFVEHTLSERYALTPEGRHLFDRCVLFLQTDNEYTWTDDDFIGASSRPPGFLGLIEYHDPEVRRLAELHVYGPEACWPFSRVADFNAGSTLPESGA